MKSPDYKVEDSLNRLDTKVLPSSVNPLDAFINTQVAADITTTTAAFSSTVTSLQTKPVSDPAVQLGLLQTQRGIAISQLDQRLDNGIAVDPNDPNAAIETFLDKQVTTDFTNLGTDFSTWKADLATNPPSSPTVGLDELKINRDLLIANLDQSFDLTLDKAPTTPETTPPTTTPTTPPTTSETTPTTPPTTTPPETTPTPPETTPTTPVTTPTTM